MGVDHIAFADDDYDETIDAENCGALWNNDRPLYVLKENKVEARLVNLTH